MCNVHAPHVDPGKCQTLTRTTFMKLAPIFPFLKRVSYGGNGEPFLAKDIFWQIHQIRSVNPKVSIQAFSNGTLFHSPSLVDATLGAVDELSLSIDAVTPETYAAIRVGADVKRHIYEFADHRRAKAPAPTLPCRCDGAAHAQKPFGTDPDCRGGSAIRNFPRSFQGTHLDH